MWEDIRVHPCRGRSSSPHVSLDHFPLFPGKDDSRDLSNPPVGVTQACKAVSAGRNAKSMCGMRGEAHGCRVVLSCCMGASAVLVRLAPWVHTSEGKAGGQGQGPPGTADAAWLSLGGDVGGQPAQREVCKTLGAWRIFPRSASIRFRGWMQGLASRTRAMAKEGPSQAGSTWQGLISLWHR